MRTVGVEEEFLLVDLAGVPVGVATAAAEAAPVELELMQQMLETGTQPCLAAGDLVVGASAGKPEALGNTRATRASGCHATHPSCSAQRCSGS